MTPKTGVTSPPGRSHATGAIWRRCGYCRRPAWSAPWRRCRSSSSSPGGWPSAGRSTTWRRPLLLAGVRSRFRLGVAARPDDDGRALRRAGRRSGPAREEGPARRPGLAGRPAGGAVLVLPFGPGRPGWHVECAAIATEYLSRVFDVQAGGTDLIFPHHEMSASHARVALGDAHAGGGRGRRSPAITCTRAWCGLDGEKMSKSLGNLVFVSSLLATAPTRWRSGWPSWPITTPHDWDWTAAGLAAASSGSPAGGPPWAGCWPAPPDPASQPGAPRRRRPCSPTCRERMADDLDAPGALAAVDRLGGGGHRRAGPAAGCARGGAARPGRRGRPAGHRPLKASPAPDQPEGSLAPCQRLRPRWLSSAAPAVSKTPPSAIS